MLPSGLCGFFVGRCPALVVVLAVMPSAVVHAQGFKPPEQFMNLSFGSVRTSIRPPDFVWHGEEFPGGLVLPRRDSDGELELSAGAMVADRVAVMAGLDLLGGSGDVRVAPIHFYGGMRRWIAKRVWIEGDVGPSLMRVISGEGEDQVDEVTWGLGLMGVVGYDLLQRRNPSFVTRGHFVAHVQARVSTHAAGGMRVNNISALLGFAVGY